jgi:AcrR family transcriptional regulator
VSSTADRRPYRGVSPEERDAARRRALLDVALEQFGTLGFNGTSIEGLCRESGVAARYFYALFGGREALFVALYEELVAGLAQRVATAVAESPPVAEDAARAAFSAIADAYEHDPRVARIVLVEVLSVSPEVERHRRAAIRRFAELIEQLTGQLMEAGALPPRSLRLTSLAVVGAATELLVHHAAGESGASRDEVVDELVRVYLRAFT